MHWIPVLLVLLIYMFRAAFLPIIRSSWPYICFGTFYAVVMNRLLPGVGWHFSAILLLVANGHKCIKMYQSRCTAKNSWWWAERLPETCRVIIPIKLESSASVGFIHKESVTMHGHTIVKFNISYWTRDGWQSPKTSCLYSTRTGDQSEETLNLYKTRDGGQSPETWRSLLDRKLWTLYRKRHLLRQLIVLNLTF